MMEKLRYKYCNKRITTSSNGSVQSNHQGDSKLNSGVHTLTNDKIIKNRFNKNNIAIIKTK